MIIKGSHDALTFLVPLHIYALLIAEGSHEMSVKAITLWAFTMRSWKKVLTLKELCKAKEEKEPKIQILKIW